MKSINLHILPKDLLETYCLEIGDGLEKKFGKLHDSELSIETFSFYTSVSAVFSSKIEGEDIELDSYIKHKRMGAHFLPDYTLKIDDLYDACLFAQKSKLNQATLEKAHALITKHILQPAQRGKIRTGNMFVVAKDGKIEYVAAIPAHVKTEMQKLYDDIELLLNTELSFKEGLPENSKMKIFI